MSVGVVVGTYGDMDVWADIAERAIQSIRDQSCPPDKWIHVHSDTLANARNQGAKAVDTDWLIFLDADDELDPRYVESMRNRRVFSNKPHEIVRPSTLGVYPDGSTDERPVMIPWTDLKKRNCVIIGAMCPSDLFHEIGGFGEWPILEDWALWRAMVARGASIADCKEAIYRVHVRPESRNTDHKAHGNVYRQIQKAVPL